MLDRASFIWSQDFYPVCTAEQHFSLAAMLKVENAGVLQKAPYNASYCDVVTQIRYPWAQAADAANNEFDAHVSLGSFVQQRYELFVY